MRARTRAQDRWLEAAFRVHPGELRPTLLLFLLSFSTVGAFVAGRAVRDALFLARLSPARLPLAYVAAGAAVALAGAVHARFAGRHRPARLLGATSGAFAILAVAARLLPAASDAYALALYLGVEVMGALTVVQFWTAASEVNDARAARRLFGLIGAGGTLANVLVGLAVRGLAPRTGVASLLWLCAALLATSAVLVAFVPLGPARLQLRAPAAAPAPWRSPHLRAVGALVVLAAVCTIFLDYQFKAIAAAHFQRDPVALAGFFGTFSCALGAAALALQLLATGRALERLGLFGALFILPAAFGAGSALLLVAPALWVVAAAKAGEDAVRYTVHDAGTQILYLPLSPALRARAKALADGVMKPAGIALAGLCLAALTAAGAPLSALAAATLLLAAAWAGGLALLRPRYAAELRAALMREGAAAGSAAPPLDEPGARATLRAAARSFDPRQAALALELAGLADFDLSDDALSLLAHADPELRRLACEHLAARPHYRHAAPLLASCADPQPSVRAAAARCLCAVLGDEALAAISPLLFDPHPEVRAAAVEGLLRHGGLDGIVAAAPPLRVLCSSERAGDRAAAAGLLGAAGVRGFYKPLHGLMADPDPGVRRAAVVAAGRLRAPELVPALVYQLGAGGLARQGAAALASYGPSAERVMAKVLANPREELAVRRALPPVLARLGTASALECVSRLVEAPDRALRLAALRAAAALLSARPDFPADRAGLDRACQREIGRAWHALGAAGGLSVERWGAGAAPDAGALGLLRSALREKSEASAAAALELAAALQPEVALAAARLGRTAGAHHRPHAVELLDTVLDPELQRRLVPLVEDRPEGAKLRAGAALYDLPERRPEEWVRELLRDECGWVAAAAAHLAGTLRLDGCAARLSELAASGEGPVREEARASLERLEGAAAAAREVAG